MRDEEGLPIELPFFNRIIADSDLDGLCAAAILKSYNPDAEVVFSHAALIRSGRIDDVINHTTAMVDLPFHPNCGWYLDHHQTNKPNLEEEDKFTKRGEYVTGKQPLLQPDWPTIFFHRRLIYPT